MDNRYWIDIYDIPLVDGIRHEKRFVMALPVDWPDAGQMWSIRDECEVYCTAIPATEYLPGAARPEDRMVLCQHVDGADDVWYDWHFVTDLRSLDDVDPITGYDSPAKEIDDLYYHIESLSRRIAQLEAQIPRDWVAR